ncbi:efflux RND transporter periplasmic adaptor subunit [Flavivirga rizhaonensis]|uniref:Efflux RND transporter periplasmic adaptor subunit n=1 Tax=Flavivirga rizhaonensis TaxID=2559571 RepID=A0A4S1DZ76_9FLAO|nr:efflux RND transporter periplasmic adaptor subunit [Flavivirga rizhaonensis]TGV03520.1 efflux RND transporter periplasmic adaptor subunit [Flavivirga rizhaonensis]
MKIKRYTLITILSLIAFVSCKEEKQVKEVVLRPVKYAVVGDVDAHKIRTFSGTAKAGDAINLSFRSGGIITKVNHWKGSKVKKGDVIARLDNVEASLAYEQSVSALKSAESSMNTAKSNLNRIKSLYEKGSNSLSDYEAAKNSYQTALDQYESAKRNKSIQATQLSYGVVKAPKDGLIADTDGGVGERVAAGHVFAILNAGKDIKIEVGLPENVVNRAAAGMKTKLEFSAIEGKVFDGTVTEVAPIINPEAATYNTAIFLDIPDPEIKPGMAADVTFNFSETTNTSDTSLIIPVKAVGEDGKGRFVFLITTKDKITGTVNKRYIELGELTTDGFKVKKGLVNGDKIATAGLQTLLDGQDVRLK